MNGFKRPVLRFHGGKYRLAPWILAHLPAHRIYVEPYAGGASVLLCKPRSFAEVLNDLDGDLVTLFRVLRDPEAAKELARLVCLTPFSRQEFESAFLAAPKGDVVEQSRRLLVRSWMGFSTNGASAGKASRVGFNGRLDRSGKLSPDRQISPDRLCVNTGFRAVAFNSFTTPAHDWARWPVVIKAVTARLQGVCIEHRPALHVIRQLDGETTLFYCDPPYVKSTRSDTRDDYRHEMTEDDHVRLAEVLHDLKGMAVISGYPSALYAELYQGWRKVEKAVFADRAAARRECLWLNPAASDALTQRSLFT